MPRGHPAEPRGRPIHQTPRTRCEQRPETSPNGSRENGDSQDEDAWQTFADTIVREVKEETGLEITAGDVIGERVHPKTDRHMVYVAAKPTGKLEAVGGDPDELSEVRWASLAEADELLPGMFEPVKDHLGHTR
jgi:8-oxo-dGTP pyrophosphatase MutT (NUDIX family)